MNRIKIFAKSVIIISSILLATACKKNGESKLFPAHFTCEVDGVLYRGNMPYLAPPGAKRNPRTTYLFSDNFKEFRFYSAIGLLEEGKSEALSYHLFIYIPLTEHLETNKEYLFEAIPGEDYGMSYFYTPKSI